jgi:hypothetical protein
MFMPYTLNYPTYFKEYASNNVPNISPGEVVAYHQEDVNCAHNTGNDASQHQFFGGILWITNYQIIWKSTERESMVRLREFILSFFFFFLFPFPFYRD